MKRKTTEWTDTARYINPLYKNLDGQRLQHLDDPHVKYCSHPLVHNSFIRGNLIPRTERRLLSKYRYRILKSLRQFRIESLIQGRNHMKVFELCRILHVSSRAVEMHGLLHRQSSGMHSCKPKCTSRVFLWMF